MRGSGSWWCLVFGVTLLACGPQQQHLMEDVVAEVEPEPEEVFEAARHPEHLPLHPRRLTFAVVGDLNGRYGSTLYNEEVHRAVEKIIAKKPDLVISVGDMVAGQRAKLNYAAMWESFHTVVSDPLAEAGIPFAVVVGNHDGSAYPRYAEEREIYVEQWLTRRPEVDFVDDRFYPLYYAFTLHDVLFVGLDATTIGPLDPGQRAWLAELLARYDHYDVKVLFAHLPLVPIVERKGREIIRDAELESLLERHRVTLFMSGHHHAYYPARMGQTTLLHVGCLGGGPRPLRNQPVNSPRTMSFVSVGGEGALGWAPGQAPLRIDTYLAPRFERRIEPQTLPPILLLGERALARVDVDEVEASVALAAMLAPYQGALGVGAYVAMRMRHRQGLPPYRGLALVSEHAGHREDGKVSWPPPGDFPHPPLLEPPRFRVLERTPPGLPLP